MAQSIFRQTSLEKLSSPEQLDRTLTVTSPKAWLFILALGIIVSLAVVWGIIGNIPSTTIAQGVIVHEDGLNNMTDVFPSAAIVKEVLIKPGDFVKEGQPVVKASLFEQPPLSEKKASKLVYIRSNITGQVSEVFVNEGIVISTGTTLAHVEDTESPLLAVIYVPFAKSKLVKVGMVVNLMPSNVEKENYGLLKGVITKVGEFPSSLPGLKTLFQNEAIIQAISSMAPVVEVTVRLLPNKKTISGFQWTTSSGPPFKISAGTQVTGEIILSNSRPIELILPIKIDN
jgi:hypothetical protein